ncbi:restriction endonuclease subunit S [uncultured Mucilaginibacter sp.]|uniref:restriction endonuclease subunit S n=1 Tax=uncultured Mucilaginibacter sp. TaxID=797541 RepID=UPI0025F9DEF6|nr:restriction endonuclease subunit S [uncultured Mucilaginibacter sp.]
MELMEGYKQTEVGIIPAIWDIKPLVECCKKITDGTHDTPKKVEIGVPFITAIHVKENNIDFDSCYFLPEEVHRVIFNRCNPEKGDVLMVNIGAGVATTALVSVDYEFSLKNVALIKPDTSKLIGKYLNYWQIFSKTKIVDSISSGGAQPFLSLNQIGGLIIALPAIAEQTAIATALNDADALITSLERLIEKKRAIKRGAMQQLLKPKEGWDVKKLGEIAEIVGGGTPSTFIPHYWNGTINWFTPTEIGAEKYSFESKRKITKDGKLSCSAKILPIGTILLTTRAGIGDASILMQEGCTNQGFQSLIAKEGYHNEYLYYLILTLKSVLLQNASGSTFLEISPNKIKQIDVSVPNYEVQTTIATVLSDIDLEITTLEKKLTKCKMLKQGMMQELLTGKIRII